MPRKKILFIFGTRPEAIKLAPVILKLKESADHFDVKICVTAQHREMLDQVLNFFGITPDFDLDIMQPNQDLYTVTSTILTRLQPVLQSLMPDLTFVHGDTTTTMAASLACFYSKLKVAHVESGLRTFDRYSPFPEEMNRVLTTRLTDFHFAPTTISWQNLIDERVPEESICVTGNTVIDALAYTVNKMSAIDDIQDVIPEISNEAIAGKRIILVTGHRRENHGDAFRNICLSLKTITASIEDACVIFPVHPNPNVRNMVHEELGGHDRILLIEPLIYQQFVWLMNKSFLILTDSGGIQEEAPTLKKPVFVMRETTERPEALEFGFIKLVGTAPDRIVTEIVNVLNNEAAYQQMQASFNPYGDGNAADKIEQFLLNHL